MTRTRLSPEARRDQLMDVAKQTIVGEGLQQFALKQLATDADVSEPLVFHYFSSRIDLLQQLLEREFGHSIDSLETSLDGVEDLDEILRIYVTRNYDQYDEEVILDILLAEPEIASVVAAQRNEHQRERERFLVNTIAKALGIRRKKAALVALMASAASMSAAKFAHQNEVSRADAIEIVVRFAKAGFESQRSDSQS